MNLSEQLDLAIKLEEKGTTAGGYTLLHNGKKQSKTTYVTNDEWLQFVEAMKGNPLQPEAYP